MVRDGQVSDDFWAIVAPQDAGLADDATEDDVEHLLAVDSTIVRGHQHAAGARKGSELARASGHTGGLVELQEISGRAG